MNSRCLVTGAGGMLGSALIPELQKRYSVYATDKVSKPGLDLLDVRDSEALRLAFESCNPDIVYHLAAETDLEFCEIHSNIASLTNAGGTATVARLANERGCLVVYVSTVGVFDGKKPAPYNETDEPNPLQVYGRTKLAGERQVKVICKRYIIARAGWMMGGGSGVDHKFVGKIVEQIKGGKTVIYAVDDKSGTPTYALDFAANLVAVAESGFNGTIHIACHGDPSPTRHDVATEIVRLMGEERNVRVEAVSSNYFKGTYFAPRPVSESLDNAVLRALGLDRMRPWQEALAEYLTQFPKKM